MGNGLARLVKRCQYRASSSPTSRQVFRHIIGESEAMLRMRGIIERIAPLERLPVLIEGKTGTGKELVAQAVHLLSPRCGGPFVTLNCGAIIETLAESELFGHTRGAFTGAVRTKQGHFQAAHTGTLFLDEIGDLSLGIQVKLLRALDAQEVYKVGSVIPEEVDVRVIAATNLDLSERVREGRFREDLYYRIYVGVIDVPELRQRREDIPLLADYFLSEYNVTNGISIRAEEGSWEILKGMDFNGNVRELRSQVHRLAALSSNGIIRKDTILHIISMPPDSGNGRFVVDHPATLEEVERAYVIHTFRKARGSQSEAARMLGISRATLRRRLESYGLEDLN